MGGELRGRCLLIEEEEEEKAVSVHHRTIFSSVSCLSRRSRRSAPVPRTLSPDSDTNKTLRSVKRRPSSSLGCKQHEVKSAVVDFAGAENEGGAGEGSAGHRLC